MRESWSGERDRYMEAYHVYNNVKLYSKYSRSSTPTVIFIAGLGDSCETWEVVQNRISEAASTFSYDRAGIGRSQCVSGTRTCRCLAEELSELLQVLDVEPPFVLVGHSFGGLVARLYAGLYPQNICGIVLVDAAPEFKELAYERVLPEERIAENREYLMNPMQNSERIDKMRSYEQIAEHVQQYDIPLSIIMRGLPDEWNEGWPHLAILEVEHKLQAEFQRLSTSSKIRIANQSGHYIHHDEPEIVVEEIMNMLEGSRN